METFLGYDRRRRRRREGGLVDRNQPLLLRPHSPPPFLAVMHFLGMERGRGFFLPLLPPLLLHKDRERGGID